MYCRYCGAELKHGANFCTKCGQSAAKASDAFKSFLSDYSKPAKTDRLVMNIDLGTVLSKPHTLSLCHTVLSVGYVLYQIASFVDTANDVYNTTDPFAALGNLLAVGIAAHLMKPHLILMVTAAVFSVLGILVKRPWAYLTSAIIQTIGTVILLGILIAQPLWLILMIAIIVLGFVAYSKLKS